MKILKTSIRVIILFAVAMALSFVPEYFPAFFGDFHCSDAGPGGCHYTGSRHSYETHWGYRHWLYFMMGLALAVIQAIDIMDNWE